MNYIVINISNLVVKWSNFKGLVQCSALWETVFCCILHILINIVNYLGFLRMLKNTKYPLFF